uniref:Uncharacterized protein n=1 Tax=Acrobeloides nanus TaxID=290746 RepID=A0A914EL16_9BILA
MRSFNVESGFSSMNLRHLVWNIACQVMKDHRHEGFVKELKVDAELDTEELIERQESAELLEDCISLINTCMAGDYFPVAPSPHEISVTALELDTICGS